MGMLYDLEAKLKTELAKHVEALALLANVESVRVKVIVEDRSYLLSATLEGTLKRHEAEWFHLANFMLSEFPGNGNVVVSNGVYITAAYRRNGLGMFLNRLRTKCAKEAGAIAILATVRCDNDAEQRLLLGSGWVPAGAQEGAEAFRFGGLNGVGGVNLWVHNLSQ